MRMNTNIPMMGQPVNVLASFGQGQQMGAQTNDIRQTNAMRNMLAEQGPGIRAGDPNALDALSRFDPQAALGVEGARQGMRINEEQLKLAYESSRQGAAKVVMQMNEAERKDQAAKLERGLAALTTAQSPEQWDSIAQQLQQPELVGQFDQKAMLFAQAMGLGEALKMAQGPQPQSPEAKLFADERAGLVPAGTFGSGGNDSAKEQQIARIMSTGVPREVAIGIADGVLKSDRHPVSGVLQVVDMASGQVVYGGQQAQGQQPTAQPTAPTTSMPQGTDFSAGTGVGGAISHIGNTVSEILGAGLIAPENERATQALRNLQNQTMITLADGVAGRPSNFLLERFEQLTVAPNSPFQGPGRARERLNQTRDMIDMAIQMNRDLLGAEVTPNMRAQATQNIAALNRLRSEYGVVIEAFGRRETGTVQVPDAALNNPALVRAAENQGVTIEDMWGVMTPEQRERYSR